MTPDEIAEAETVLLFMDQDDIAANLRMWRWLRGPMADILTDRQCVMVLEWERMLRRRRTELKRQAARAGVL